MAYSPNYYGVFVAEPSETTPDVRQLVRGDSYDGVGNPVLSWTTTRDYASGWTGQFTIRHRVTGSVLVNKEMEIPSANSVRVSLTSTDTAFALLVSDDEFGPHPYDIQ